MEQQVFNIKEVAKTYGVSVSTIDRMVRAGSFPQPIRIGKRRKGWTRIDVEIYISKPKPLFQPDSATPSLTYSKTWRAVHGTKSS